MLGDSGSCHLRTSSSVRHLRTPRRIYIISHSKNGVAGNEKADEWAKLASEEPGAHGIEWLGYRNHYGGWRVLLPRSLATIRREITEKKWAEAESWADCRITTRICRMWRNQHTNRTVEECPRRLAGRYLPVEDGPLCHRPIPPRDEEPDLRKVCVGANTRYRRGCICSRIARARSCNRRPCG